MDFLTFFGTLIFGLLGAILGGALAIPGAGAVVFALAFLGGRLAGLLHPGEEEENDRPE